MRFDPPLVLGTLVRRYNRFLADVELDRGGLVTAHVPNTGSMKSTRAPGSRAALSIHDDPKRKLKWTLELVQPEGCSWVGVNTLWPNRIVEEAIVQKRIRPLRCYDRVRREVKYGKASRIDLLLEKGERRCYVEVKNVTYKEGRRALFPDAVTARGTKHLRELAGTVRRGHRGVIFFLVNRADCTAIGPAGKIDPLYAETLERAEKRGVELLAYRADVSPEGITIDRKLEVVF